MITQPSSPLTVSVSTSPVTCFGGTNGTVSGVGFGGTSPYSYLWTGGATSPTLTGLSAGNYTISVTDFNGCVKKDTITISQPTNPGDSIHFSASFCQGDDKITLHIQSGLGNYSWYAGSDTNAIILSNYDSLEVFNPSVGAIYTVVIHQSNSSCPSVITNVLNYSPPINLTDYIVKSNVFTPDGDGKNDKFDLNQFAKVKDFHIEIYNRWGLKVYESSDLNNQWDGKINGDSAAEGVYFWIASYTSLCTPDGEPHTNKGFVQLLRGK